jgi:hypothetical protein
MHVGAIHRAPVDDVGTVDGFGAFLADVAELRRLLEAQLSRAGTASALAAAASSP